MEAKSIPSFFKLYLPEHKHNSYKLLIPPPFIKYFNGVTPKKVKLRNLQGKVWKVKLETVNDGRVYITKGWNEYVRNHSLIRGDFLVFKLFNTSEFHVKVFGIDGVIKEEPVDKEAAASLGKADVPKNMQFSKIFQPYNKHYVGLPENVIKKCEYNQSQEVTLREEKGCTIVTDMRKFSDRVNLVSRGFKELWETTKVKVGDKLDFEVIVGEGRTIKEILLKITPRSERNAS